MFGELERFEKGNRVRFKEWNFEYLTALGVSVSDLPDKSALHYVSSVYDVQSKSGENAQALTLRGYDIPMPILGGKTMLFEADKFKKVSCGV